MSLVAFWFRYTHQNNSPPLHVPCPLGVRQLVPPPPSIFSFTLCHSSLLFLSIYRSFTDSILLYGNILSLSLYTCPFCSHSLVLYLFLSSLSLCRFLPPFLHWPLYYSFLDILPPSLLSSLRQRDFCRIFWRLVPHVRSLCRVSVTLYFGGGCRFPFLFFFFFWCGIGACSVSNAAEPFVTV